MKAINLTFCDCNKFVEKTQWKQYKEIEEVISKKIHEQLPKAKILFKKLILPEKLKEKTENEVLATLKGEEYKIKVIFKLAKCNLCEKEGSTYFEAILQIRCNNMDVLEKTIGELNKRVTLMKTKGMFINKAETLKDGYNLYMTDKKLTQILAKDINNRFGGTMNTSAQLFSRNKQTSKNIYRINIILRLPEFTAKDIIAIENKVYQVDKTGKLISVIDLDMEKRYAKKYSEVENHIILTKHETYISKTHPELEVINPFDFQSSTVKNKPQKSFVPGEKVKVVVHKGVYIVQ